MGAAVSLRRAASVMGGAFILVLVTPGAAAAAARFASPTGAGTACTVTAPCGILTAVNSAGNGDDVTIEPGVYTPTMSLDDGANTLAIHGQAGAPRPVIESSAGVGILLHSPGTSVSFLEVNDAGSFARGIWADVPNQDNPINRVIAHVSGNNAFACTPSSALTNSVCLATGPNEVAGSVENTNVTLGNDTLEATGSAGLGLEVNGSSGGAATAILTNSIIHGTFDDIQAGTDSFPGGSAIVTADHSNYAHDVTSKSGTTNTVTVTTPGPAPTRPKPRHSSTPRPATSASSRRRQPGTPAPTRR